ncbi:MAG: glycosyltransferase family 39 protein [Opitutaceae bacterium]
MLRRALTPSPAFLCVLALLLALFHAVLAVTATGGKSMTADEIAHLTAGHAYNTRNDYRFQPENGNLPQRWAALPLLAAGAPLPGRQLETWQVADIWNYGHTFFYEEGLSTGEFLWLGRGMIALVSAATGLLIFFWSRKLFGWRGAFLSLGLFVFCPTFLAHGALATSDMMMTFFFLASVGAWWRHLEKPGAANAALSAVVLGLAFVAKFSAVLLPPMFALIALVWLVERGQVVGWKQPLVRLGRTTVLHVMVTLAVIWLFYGLRAGAFAPESAAKAEFNHGWGWLLVDMGWPAKIIWALKTWCILPEAWLYGLTFVMQFSHARGAFLNGEYSLTGWFWFFPFTFVAKTTLPLLALFATSCFAGLRSCARRGTSEGVGGAWRVLRPLTPLLALFFIYWATSLVSHLNIGHRHILPTYPVLFILAGWLGRFFDFRRPVIASVLTGLVVWHAAESTRIRPHYLAYFNQLVGGPQNGWRHLVDSSLDWGQDLPGLAAWLERNNPTPARAPVFLSYFGTGEPAYEGISAHYLPSLPNFGGRHPWQPLTAGIYCVSATMLQQVYGEHHAWTLALEKEYQELRPFESVFLEYQNSPSRRAELLKEFPEERWSKLTKLYQQLRLERLCFFLRVRPIDAQIGYSICVFRLTADEVRRATAGSLAEWSGLIEETVMQSRRGH